MKTERTASKISILDTIYLSVFMIVVFNGVIFLFFVIIGEPGFFIMDYMWISQFVFPVLYSIIQTSINRNGVLKVTAFDDQEALIKMIESQLISKSYIAIDSTTENIKYIKKTKWGRFLNYFFREDIRVKVAENEVLVFAKRNHLSSIEWNLIYGKKYG